MKNQLCFWAIMIAIACGCSKPKENCSVQNTTAPDSSLLNAPNTFIFLAEGFEEIEAIAPLDILRRGNVNVHTVSITDNKQVKGANGVIVNADYTLNDIKNTDIEMIVLPGGMPGAQNLSECDSLMALVNQQYKAKKGMAAICAAPAFIFSKMSITDSLQLTMYPDAGLMDMLKGKNISNQGVVVYNQIITGKGPGYSYDFGYAILEKLKGQDIANGVAEGMLYKENK